MLRRFGFAALFVLSSIPARTSVAVETALDAISADAGVVGRLKNPQATLEKFVQLVNQIMPDLGENIRAQAGQLGNAISNPSQAGVDRQADWWVAVYPRPDRDPGIVFIIPATDLKAMKAGLSDSFKFIEHGKFGVYTEDADVADKVAALLKGNGKPISPTIDKDSQVVFDKGDISIFLHITRLAAVYKVQLAQLREQAAQALENIPAIAGGTQNPKAMTEFASQLVNVVFQGIDDAQSCTIAAMVSKEGLAFEDLVRVAPASKTDQLLQKSKPNSLDSLASLPAGALGYFGVFGDFADLIQFSMKMVGGLLSGKEEASKEYQAALAEMQKLKFGVIASSFGLGGAEEGALRSITVSEVSDPMKMRELSHKLFKSIGTVETPGIKQSYELKTDAEKYGPNSADLLKVTMEMANGAGQEAFLMDRLMKTLYGPEGMVTRIVYLKDKVVQTNGGGKPALEKALVTLDKKSETATGNGPFQQARARLADKANLVLLFDLPGTLAKLVGLAAESGMLPIPLAPEILRTLDLKPSFLGLSAATEPQALRVKSNIPVEQAQGIAKIVTTAIGVLNGGAQ